VQGGESRLGQVFLNLVANAAQAIAEGSHDEHEIRISTGVDPAGRVTVEVADTGPGMPPEVLARLFEPFFTTKPMGVGTGLGLSICQRIVTELGGTIEVKSRVGVGTTVTVSLPAAPAAAAPSPTVTAPEPAPVRRGRILIVDDDLMAARALERALATEHDVTTAGSAQEALDQIGKGERFDVIVSDLMMPQISGMDFHARLRDLVPEQAERMIFLTAGAFTTRARAFLEESTLPRLEKPYEIRELRALVNEWMRPTSGSLPSSGRS